MNKKKIQYDKNYYKKYNKSQLNNLFKNACNKGEIDLVTFLTTNSEIKLNIEKESYDLGLINASNAEENSLEIIKFLTTNYRLEHHADLKKNIQEVLKNASLRGHLDVIQYLFESPDVKFSVLDELQDDFFYNACNGSYELIKYVLVEDKVRKHLNPYYKDEYGFNSLLKIATIGDLKTFKFLLNYFEKNPNPNCHKVDFQWYGVELEGNAKFHNVFTLACQKGSVELAKFIWDKFQPIIEDQLRLEKTFIYIVEQEQYNKSLTPILNFMVEETSLEYNSTIEELEKDTKNPTKIPEEIKNMLILKKMKTELEQNLATKEEVKRPKI